MDLATIEPAVSAWVVKVTGLPAGAVVWENMPRPTTPDGRIATLSWVSSAGRGVDEHRDEEDPVTGDLVPVMVGQRSPVLQVTVETHDQRAGQTARHLCELARDRAWWPSARAILKAANVAMASVGEVRNLVTGVDDRVMSRAAFEVRLNATSFTRDTDGAGPPLEHMKVTSHIKTPAGVEEPAALQLNDQEMP